MEKNKFASCKECLLVLFFSRNVKKTRTDQSIIIQFSYSLQKEMSQKPSKVAAAKTYFSSVYVIDTACFDECFFFYLRTARHCFL